MNLYTWIAAGWALLAGLCLVGWFSALREVKRWRVLENNQVKYSRALEAQLAEVRDERERIEKFKAQPGMETVPDHIAQKIMGLQADNRELATELNELRLQAAKYMDLYRLERYKPHRKHT